MSISIPTGRQRRRKGDFTTTEYRVLEHADYVAVHPESCPPLRYNPETGKLFKPGELAAGLGRVLVKKIPDETGFMASMPDWMAEVVRQGIAEKKSASTGNPVQAPSTGNPVVDAAPEQEILHRASTGNPVATSTGNPVATTTGNPVTSLKVKPENDQSDTTLQPASPAPGTEPGTGKSNSGRDGRQDVRSVSSSTKSEKQEWLDFIRLLDESMRYAEPTAAERHAVLLQLAQLGDAELFAETINDWAQEQSPPIETLNYGRWSRWLENGAVAFQECKEDAEWKKNFKQRHPRK